jgi:succinate dehydrogenase / fumarate reductase, cytochrome b subunit
MPAFLSALTRFCLSSIGKKILVALTGAAMMGFLIGHLSGNLLAYGGPDAINSYAEWLHSLGKLLWIARLGLIGAVVVHIIFTILLVIENRMARDQTYACPATVGASKASRTMIYSGAVILAFLLFHLSHFTVTIFNEFGTDKYLDAEGRRDVYRMLKDGFGVPWVSFFYIVAVGLLCMHLSHGFASVFQTLGLSSNRFRPVVEISGYIFSIVLFLGYASIPVAFWFGILK